MEIATKATAAVTAVCKGVETVAQTLKNALHKVEVSKEDATQVEREIEGELFEKLNEKYEFMQAREIEVADLPEYLDVLMEAYGEIGEQIKKKVRLIVLTKKEWMEKIVEWKINTGDGCGARYGMLVFTRSGDGKFVNCAYVLYKLEFKIAPKRIVTTKKHSRWWGLQKWTTERTEYQEKEIGLKSVKMYQNYFRYKALEYFRMEGVIDQINFVRSSEDIQD